MRLERTFHPVGHGAFCTERFYDEQGRNVANIVFDCGCYERPAKGKKRRDFVKEINAIVDQVFPFSTKEKKAQLKPNIKDKCKDVYNSCFGNNQRKR